MPRQERQKTKYPGVYFIEFEKAGKTERVYYIHYRLKGTTKLIEEKAGYQNADDMTAARANQLRSARIDKKDSPNREKRERQIALTIEKAGKMTLDRLWEIYEEGKPDSKAIKTDKGNYQNHLSNILGNKEPQEIIRLDVDRLRLNLLKTLKPQTVKHVLGLLKRVVKFGVSHELCLPLTFDFELPKVDNIKTEDLNLEQLKSLLKAINNSSDKEAAAIMKLALYTGMRRGEMFKLKWNDVDFDRGFITIHDPKGGKSQKIPLNQNAREVLENYPKTETTVNNKKEISPYIFLRKDGKPFTDIRRRVNPIKKAAGIPANFRALHGLRHTYASMLASSGEVDLYTLQKLLTHKSPAMTQRYAHLRDETLKNASVIADGLFDAAARKTEAETVTA